MLSAGIIAAPSTSCIRCQLLYVVRNSSLRNGRHRLRNAPFQSFSIKSRRCQGEHEAEEEPSSLSNRSRRRDVFIKKLYPNGRIFGQGATRQRQIDEKLATKSLGGPSEVIVFRDEPSKTPKNGVQKQQYAGVDDVITGAQFVSDVQSWIAMEGEVAQQDDIDTSIESLRPENAVLEKQDYVKLVKSLSESYNAAQLARYMVKVLSVPVQTQSQVLVQSKEIEGSDTRTKKPQVRPIPRSEWQPGRTPIERGRLVTVGKDPNASLGGRSSKKAFIEQILRRGWHLTIHSEEQKVGELEMQLELWQFQLLVDNDPNAVEAVINSKLLYISSQVTPYRPSNTIRIRARRQDAEEIANKFEASFANAEVLWMYLSNESDRNRKALRRSAKWRAANAEVLKTIAIYTKTHIDWKNDDRIALRSLLQKRVWHAQRYLLQLLDLPQRNVSMTMTVKLESNKDAPPELALLPIDGGRHLPIQHRGKELTRLVVPANKVSTGGDDMAPDPRLAVTRTVASFDRLAVRKLTENAAKLTHGSQLSDDDETETTSLWNRNIQYEPHLVEFGSVLHDKAAQDEKCSGSALSSGLSEDITFLAQTPSMETLASYMRPMQAATEDGRKRDPPEDQNLPFFRCTFIPSPFGKYHGTEAAKIFPPVELVFRQCGNAGTKSMHLELLNMKVVLSEQITNIRMPDQVVDARFIARSTVAADMAKIAEYDAVQGITRHLKYTMETPTVILSGGPAVTLRIPASTVSSSEIPPERNGNDTDYTRDIPFPYLFSGLEACESRDLEVDPSAVESGSGSDRQLAKALRTLSNVAFFRFTDVQGGKLSGQRNEMHLVQRSSETSKDFVSSALGVAAQLTRISAGTVVQRVHGAANVDSIERPKPVQLRTYDATEIFALPEQQFRKEDDAGPKLLRRTTRRVDEVADEGRRVRRAAPRSVRQGTGRAVLGRGVLT